MKNPFRRRETEDEGVFIVKQRRPRESLRETAERLIQRRMKKDPDGYGITAAEKIKGIHHEPPKTVKDFLRELKEYRDIMDEAGLGGGEGKGLLQQILEVLPTLPPLLEQVRQLQGQGMPQGNRSPLIQIPQQQQLEQPKTEPKAQAQAQPEAEPQPMTLSLETIAPYLQLEPEVAIAAMKQAVIEGNQQVAYWVGFLSNSTYEAIIALVTPFRENPMYAPFVEQLLSKERQPWIETLLSEARKAVKELKSQ